MSHRCPPARPQGHHAGSTLKRDLTALPRDFPALPRDFPAPPPAALCGKLMTPRKRPENGMVHNRMVLTALCAAISHAAIADDLNGQVVGVPDGDTLTLR